MNDLCLICNGKINDDNELYLCPDCGTKYHLNCWESTGHCVNPECKDKSLTLTEPSQQETSENSSEATNHQEGFVASGNDDYKICPQCGDKSADNTNFCKKCGFSLTGNYPTVKPVVRTAIQPIYNQPVVAGSFCSKCGSNVQPGLKFCNNCGQPVSSYDKEKKKIIPIIIGIGATLLFALIIILVIVFLSGVKKDIDKPKKTNFNDKYGDIYYASWCEIASDGSYIRIDTNPSDIDDEDFDYSYYQNTFTPANNAIEQINKDLGFSEALKNKMSNTSAMQGVQSDSNEKYKVSWSYHPDKGLEVIYELNDTDDSLDD